MSDGPAGARLQINLVDGIRLGYAGHELRLGNRKACAMLGYLALSPSGDERRERLAGLFWSEFSEEKARTTLRQALHEAQEALGRRGMLLRPDRSGIALPRAQIDVDILDILAAVARRSAPDELLRRARIAETLMAGFEDLDPAFNSWLLARRQTLRDQLMRSLEDGYRDPAVPSAGQRRLAEAALLLDPTNEEACCMVMLAAARAGETAVALRAYNELYRLLDSEYDMEPSARTMELVARIKQGAYDLPPEPAAKEQVVPFRTREQIRGVLVPRPEPPPAPAAEPSPRLVIEVAGFGVNGVDAGQMHLVNGFRLHLIACLVRFREWHVSDAAAAADGAEPRPAAQAASRYALDANVYQVGRTIHAVLTLREQASGVFAWSYPFELRLDRWFAAQQGIVRRIASSLNVNLSTERLMQLAGEPDVSLNVYDRWLRAQALLARFSPENWNRAATLLAETIDMAPDFSALYSSLVQMRNSVFIVHPGLFRDPAEAERTLELARRAVQLDPRDARAELCLGWSLALVGRHAQAAPHMDLACELNPNDSWTLIAAALFHVFCGSHALARDLSAQALEMTLAPSHAHWTYTVSILFCAGDYAGALRAADRAGEAIPPVLAWRAATLARLGRAAEARVSGARFLERIRAGWHGALPSDDAEIVRWFLHLFPIAEAEDWARLRDAVAEAGLPTERACFNPTGSS